jgi:hypothetical protein
MIGSADISETYSKHDIGSPIIPPNILVNPRLISDSNLIVPTLLMIKTRHKIEYDG